MSSRRRQRPFMPGVADPAAFGEQVRQSLAVVTNRPQPGQPWRDGDNLPWDDPLFSDRMLAEQLDQSHGAGSRPLDAIERQVEALWSWLDLAPGARVLDITCGPGLYAQRLAARGCHVTGVDFSPAAIHYARAQAQAAGLTIDYRLADVRQALAAGQGLAGAEFDAALLLYGQFSVFPPQTGAWLLQQAATALRSGGRLALELLDFDHLDKKSDSWWYTGRGGLWGDFEYLHLGDRTWDEAQQAVLERFYIINLETGALQSYGLSDQAYPTAVLQARLAQAGFSRCRHFPAWGGLPLDDAHEWVVTVATRD